VFDTHGRVLYTKGRNEEKLLAGKWQEKSLWVGLTIDLQTPLVLTFVKPRFFDG
jgi:hypothetical protein